MAGVYYVVELWDWKSPDRLRRLVAGWRGHIKYRLPKEVWREVITERWVNEFTYVILIRGSLLGLWIVRKLESVARKHDVRASVFEGERVIISEGYIDGKIREKIEEIPPEHVYAVKKALVTVRLPRKKEVIETMKRI